MDIHGQHSLESLLGQNPDHGPGQFGREDTADQGYVLFGGGPVTGAQVDQRRGGGEVRRVQ